MSQMERRRILDSYWLKIVTDFYCFSFDRLLNVVSIQNRMKNLFVDEIMSKYPGVACQIASE